MDRESVQAWLDKYVEAWRTYDESKIRELFTENAQYFYNPFDDGNSVRGSDAIVENWLKEKDDPNLWEAKYAPLAVEGNVGVAQGRTRYRRADGIVDREYANIFVMHFNDAGRVSHFTEYFMKAKQPT